MFRSETVLFEDSLRNEGGEAEYQEGEGGVLLRAATGLLAGRGDLDLLDVVDGFKRLDNEVGCGIALG